MGQEKIVYIVPYGDVYNPSRPKRVKKFIVSPVYPVAAMKTFTITGVDIKALKKIENGLEHGFVNHWLNFV